ncbi:MAG: glutamate--tRNA ligase family protein [Nanoarchaeota archaeon]
MIDSSIIKVHALKNAVEHDGKAIIGSVINALFNEGLQKENIKEIMPTVVKIIAEVNTLSIEQQQKEFDNHPHKIAQRPKRIGLPELDNVGKKGIIMRFAPSPSGPLHLGHAITASMSYLYVKKYGGTLYIRIEDTNPENIYPPAYKMIEKEARWLFENKIKLVIQSQRMKKYYAAIEKLLKKNAVYVCTCSQETFKKYVKAKKNCPCRELISLQQRKRWKKMFDKKGYKEGEAVVRFKSGMTNKNPAFRDFPLARINTNPHPLQKNKYKVWPLMNLAVAVDDMELKITHIIRAKDHRDNAEKQKLIFKILRKKYPHDYYLGRIHLQDLELSTSKTRKEIESGKYSGWDDPKLFTIASLKKQGYTPHAFLGLAENIGLNEVDKTLSRKELLLLLNTYNKKNKEVK